MPSENEMPTQTIPSVEEVRRAARPREEVIGQVRQYSAPLDEVPVFPRVQPGDREQRMAEARAWDAESAARRVARERAEAAELMDRVRSRSASVVSADAVIPIVEEDTEDDGSEEVAKRYNDGKAQFGLIDPHFEKGIAQVLTFGAKKYGKKNWQKSAGTSTHDEFVEGCYDSMRRHLNALARGNSHDEESGLPHLDHVSCNVMFIRYYDQYREIL